MTDERSSRIEAKLDRVLLTQAKHSVLHKQNSHDLKEHMRRTEAAEARLDVLERNKYIALGALFMAGLLSNPLGAAASKLIELLTK